MGSSQVVILGKGLFSAGAGAAISRRRRGPLLQLPPAPSPTLTCVGKGHAGQEKPSCEPLRSAEEAGRGPLQALKSHTIFTERGEVQIAARAQGAQAYTGSGCAS